MHNIGKPSMFRKISNLDERGYRKNVNYSVVPEDSTRDFDRHLIQIWHRKIGEK